MTIDRGGLRARGGHVAPGALLGLAAAALLPLFAGCTTTRPVKLLLEQPGIAVDCSGATLTWSHCYRKAGKICPYGYSVFKQTSKGGGHVAGGDFLTLVGDKAQHRRLLIQCYPRGGAPAAAAVG
jgi:hypothetical protein